MADLGAIGGNPTAAVTVARLDMPPYRPPLAYAGASIGWWVPVHALTARKGASLLRMITTPLWWGQRTIGALPVPDYKIEGHVYQRDEDGNDTPIYNCRVHLHVRRSGVLIALTRTNAVGYYRFGDLMPIADGYYAVAIDPEGAPVQNAVVLDRLQAGES